MPSPCLLCRHHHRRRRHRYAPSSPTSSRRVTLSRNVSSSPATVVVVVIVVPAIPRRHCQAGVAGRSQEEAIRLSTIIQRGLSQETAEISCSSVSDASVVTTLTSLLTSSTRNLTILKEEKSGNSIAQRKKQRLEYRYRFGNRRRKEGSTVAKEGGGGGGGGERGDSPSRCTRCRIERNAVAPRAKVQTIGILGSNSSSINHLPSTVFPAKCCSNNRLDPASVFAPERAYHRRPRARTPIGQRRRRRRPRRSTVWARHAPSTAAPRRFSRPICCS